MRRKPTNEIARDTGRAGRVLQVASAVFAIAMLFAHAALADEEMPFVPTDVPVDVNMVCATIDRVVVIKSERVLRLVAGDVVVKEYEVALGGQPEGCKECDGDQRTPEGTYMLDYRVSTSPLYRSIHISYPSDEDRGRARDRDCDPGGDIAIHGLPPKWSALGPLHRTVDWTLGGIAVTNEEIDEIWSAVPNGTPIEIRP